MNEELIIQKNELKRKIYVLEWDEKRKQINPALKIKLDEYRKQIGEIDAKLAEIPAKAEVPIQNA